MRAIVENEGHPIAGRKSRRVRQGSEDGIRNAIPLCVSENSPGVAFNETVPIGCRHHAGITEQPAVNDHLPQQVDQVIALAPSSTREFSFAVFTFVHVKALQWGLAGRGAASLARHAISNPVHW